MASSPSGICFDDRFDLDAAGVRLVGRRTRRRFRARGSRRRDHRASGPTPHGSAELVLDEAGPRRGREHQEARDGGGQVLAGRPGAPRERACGCPTDHAGSMRTPSRTSRAS
jgi:hypothetical protein